MRLLDPDPGEVWDRLTILYLKIVNNGLAGRPTDHWQTEANQLVERTGGLLRSGSETSLALMLDQLELAAVNATLWQRENDLRRLRHNTRAYETWAGEVARCGQQIQQLNDRRAALVGILNQHLGLPERPEK